MRAFHMNLLTYDANTQFPAGGAAQGKHQALRQEMANYRANVIGGNAVHLAGFTEVLVADAANPANVRQALNDFGAALGIAPGAHGRQLAVIRCGRTVLQMSEFFERSGFRARFEQKGRFSDYLAHIPTYVIIEQNPVLTGMSAMLSAA